MWCYFLAQVWSDFSSCLSYDLCFARKAEVKKGTDIYYPSEFGTIPRSHERSDLPVPLCTRVLSPVGVRLDSRMVGIYRFNLSIGGLQVEASCIKLDQFYSVRDDGCPGLDPDRQALSHQVLGFPHPDNIDSY